MLTRYSPVAATSGVAYGYGYGYDYGQGVVSVPVAGRARPSLMARARQLISK